MSAAELVLEVSTWIGLVLLAAAFLLTVWRVVQGPTLPDRVVALDMLVGIVIGFIALIAVRTGFTLYIDIAIALGLVGFLATVAFARFILASVSAKGRATDGTPDVSTSNATPLLPAKVAAKASDASSSRSAGATIEPLAGAGRARGKSKPVAKQASAKVPRKAAAKSASGSEDGKSSAATPSPDQEREQASEPAPKPASKSVAKRASKSVPKSAPKPEAKSTSKSASRPAQKSRAKKKEQE